MKRKVINLSAKEIDLMTKESLHSIKGGKLFNSSTESATPSSIKDEPWVKIGVSITF